MTLTVLIIGQSNAARMALDGSDLTANASLTEWDGASFVAPTTNGHISYGNAMITALSGEAVRIINCAVGATSLTLAAAGGNEYWLDTSTNSVYDLAKNKVNAAVGSLTIDVVLWSQGVRDANAGISAAAYSTAFQDFVTNQIRSDFINGSGLSNIPVVFMPLGQNVGSGLDDDWQGVREGQKDAIGNLSTALLSSTTLALPMVDAVHYSTAGQTLLGARAALSHQELLGLISSSIGRSVLSVENTTTTTTTVTMESAPGSDFTPTSSITGFEIFYNGNSLTISDASRLSSTTVLLTHQSTHSGSRDVRYLYGADPVITGAIHDDSANVQPLEWSDGLSSEASMTGFIGFDPSQTGGDTLVVQASPQTQSFSAPNSLAAIVPANSLITKVGIRGGNVSVDKVARIGVYTSVSGIPVDLQGQKDIPLTVGALANYEALLDTPITVLSDTEFNVVFTEGGGNVNFNIANAAATGGHGNGSRDDLSVSGTLSDPFVEDASVGRQYVVWAEYEAIAKGLTGPLTSSLTSSLTSNLTG